MKVAACIVLTILFTTPDQLHDELTRGSQLRNLFTSSDAEKILGEPAHLADSSTSVVEGLITYRCNYQAETADAKTGNTGSIYFLCGSYKEVADAKKRYSFVKESNQNHEGFKLLNGIGEEAYFHSDGQHFYFIIVRKGKYVFNMKVNRITSFTSLKEFNQVAEKVALAL